jgi:2-dehydro-3-deoxyphosphooctonate aldolase (KDO 8-P synthase)|tara:strand:+ start:3549 stop:4376 length:828 start_codon:yes stop_codon:yes gene_type:complete
VKLINFNVGIDQPLFLIAGPCVIESEDMTLRVADELKNVCIKLDVPFIFKSSFDKANRSSNSTFRGFGMEEGLRILEKVKAQFEIPVLTDIHTIDQVKPVSEIVDVLQTPAFLCRQTDFITAVAKSGRPVNIKKGQFLAPNDMAQVVNKAKEANGNKDNIMVCERGVSFGYNTLVSDMRSLSIMRETNCPVVFDATHSVQQPGGKGDRSGGQSEYVPLLARAAVASGISGVFMETHPNPKEALSDGPNAVPLDNMSELLGTLKDIDELVKARNLL